MTENKSTIRHAKDFVNIEKLKIEGHPLFQLLLRANMDATQIGNLRNRIGESELVEERKDGALLFRDPEAEINYIIRRGKKPNSFYLATVLDKSKFGKKVTRGLKH